MTDTPSPINPEWHAALVEKADDLLSEVRELRAENAKLREEAASWRKAWHEERSCRLAAVESR